MVSGFYTHVFNTPKHIHIWYKQMSFILLSDIGIGLFYLDMNSLAEVTRVRNIQIEGKDRQVKDTSTFLLQSHGKSTVIAVIP